MKINFYTLNQKIEQTLLNTTMVGFTSSFFHSELQINYLPFFNAILESAVTFDETDKKYFTQNHEREERVNSNDFYLRFLANKTNKEFTIDFILNIYNPEIFKKFSRPTKEFFYNLIFSDVLVDTINNENSVKNHLNSFFSTKEHLREMKKYYLNYNIRGGIHKYSVFSNCKNLSSLTKMISNDIVFNKYSHNVSTFDDNCISDVFALSHVVLKENPEKFSAFFSFLTIAYNKFFKDDESINNICNFLTFFLNHKNIQDKDKEKVINAVFDAFTRQRSVEGLIFFNKFILNNTKNKIVQDCVLGKIRLDNSISAGAIKNIFNTFYYAVSSENKNHAQMFTTALKNMIEKYLLPFGSLNHKKQTFSKIYDLALSFSRYNSSKIEHVFKIAELIFLFDPKEITLNSAMQFTLKENKTINQQIKAKINKINEVQLKNIFLSYFEKEQIYKINDINHKDSSDVCALNKDLMVEFSNILKLKGIDPNQKLKEIIATLKQDPALLKVEYEQKTNQSTSIRKPKKL